MGGHGKWGPLLFLFSVLTFYVATGGRHPVGSWGCFEMGGELGVGWVHICRALIPGGVCVAHRHTSVYTHENIYVHLQISLTQVT